MYVTSWRNPEYRACASPRTRLKHITYRTASLPLCALCVERLCVLLPAGHGCYTPGNRSVLVSTRRECADGRVDEPGQDYCRHSFPRRRGHGGDGPGVLPH